MTPTAVPDATSTASVIEAVIGLEIHVQLATRTKLFCGDAVTHGAAPNTAVCPVCLGLPGALPVLNERAVELAIRAAAMLACELHQASRFVRKNYFYPDLPKGYQITQLDAPLATGGFLTVARTGDPVAISRMHLEEDAGKLVHDRIPNRTAIDLNRCGIPLLEIVTEPELHCAADAVALARQLKQLLQYAGISDCDMELGSLRVDANVSVQVTGGGRAEGRTEIKNMNSFSQLERAIDQEVARQTAVVQSGGVVASDTMTWDAEAGELRVLRRKEQRSEYRYFDEPDLPPLVLSDDLVTRALRDLPERPDEREARFWHALDLPQSSARALAAHRVLADYFEDVVGHGAGARAAAGWILTHMLAWCNENGMDVVQYPVAAADLAVVVQRVESGDVTRAGARQVMAVLEAASAEGAHSAAGARVDEIIARLDLAARPDDDAVTKMIDDLLMKESALVARYRAGEHNLFGFLMGGLMRAAGAGADPRSASDRLRARLDEGI